MARNTKSLRYSYKCKDASKKLFQNKNFNKTESYNSKFTDSTFQNTSLVGAKFKFCNLNGVFFENCLIQGALFRKSSMGNVKFKNCIIISTKFDRTSLKTCLFENSVVLSSAIGDITTKSNIANTDIIQEYYGEDEFSDDLLEQVELLRSNQYINRSSVLHRKRGKINTISVKLLVQKFGEEVLISRLPDLVYEVNRDFYTLSYLIAILHKDNDDDSVYEPGPLQHRKYLNEQAETSLRTDAG